MKKSVFFIFLVVVLCVGCDNYKVKKLSKIDVTKAQSLYIDPVKTSRGGESSGTLWKINDEGVAEEVKFYDEKGKETVLNKTDVKFVVDAHENYVIVGYGPSSRDLDLGGYASMAVLTRKSDGAAFSLEEAGVPVLAPESTPTSIVYPIFKSIVYSRGIAFQGGGGNQLIKLDITSDPPTAKNILSQVDDRVGSFFVDKNENVFYESGNNWRIALKNGGYELPPTNGISGSLFGYVFGVRRSEGNEGNSPSYLDGFYYNNEAKKIETVSFLAVDNYNHYGLPRGVSYQFGDKGVVIFIGQNEFIVLDNSNKTVKKVDVGEFKIKIERNKPMSSSSGGCVYVSGSVGGQNRILRYDVAADSQTMIELKGYDVQSFVVADNEITFSALQLASGNVVVAKMILNSAKDGGEITVIKETAAKDKTVTLVRIN